MLGMEALAAAILLSTILYLVDKNHVWKKFWRVLAACAVIAVLGLTGLYVQDRYEAKKRYAAQVITPPPGFVLEKQPCGESKQSPDLPAGTVIWDKPLKK